MRNSLYTIRITAITIISFLFFHSAIAQTATIKGTVKDGNGSPLPGASVTVEATRLGTTTDGNGNYILKVPAGKYNIVVSFVGTGEQRYPVTVAAGETKENDFSITGATDLSGVVIVGSRSRQARSKLSTPVPVDVINTKDVKNFAQNDITQMLTYTAPSFQSARQTISDGTDHIDPAGLRGLGPDQTLVLMNGKRRHNTALVNINGTVGRGSVGTDLNAIPAAAIERIEVLRDGAAAQYGSDAIAGVINVVLKKYKGFTISGMAGENVTSMPYNGSNRINDGLNTQIDFVAGLVGKQKGYLTLSGQWLRRERSNRSGNDNIPLLYYGNAGAFPPTQAGVDPTAYRRWLIDLDKTYTGQRGYDRHNIYAGNSESDNKSLFLNAGLPIGKNAEFYLSGGVGSRDGFATGFSRNPNSVSQQPVITNNQRYYFDGFLPEIHTKIDDGSILGGVRVDAGEWNIDVSETYGKNSIDFTIQNTGNASLAPTDLVQTSFDAGKLMFQQSTLNADLSRRYNLGDKKSFNLGFGGEFRSETFNIGAGETNSYINGGRIATVDPIPPYPGTSTPVVFGPVVPGSGSQVFPGFQPGDAINARRNIYAAYVDGELTLDKLLLAAAIRFEDYRESDTLSYSGTGTKITARYELTDNIALRGSVNTGFRAPSLHQRYFQNTSTQFVAGVPSNSLTANNGNPIVKNAFGIQELKPETSKSATIGVVGKIGGNITFTVDGYFIRIDDRIVLSTPFNRSNPLVNNILNANAVDPSVSAVQFWTNAINTETKGVDMVITDRFKWGPGNASLSLAANFNQNSVVGPIHTNSVIDDPKNNPSLSDPNANPANDLSATLFDRQQKSRIEVGQPRSKINLTFNYSLKQWEFVLRAVRFGGTKYLHNLDPYSMKSDGTYWNDVALGTDQSFGAKITTDLIVTYKFCSGSTFSYWRHKSF